MSAISIIVAVAAIGITTADEIVSAVSVKEELPATIMFALEFAISAVSVRTAAALILTTPAVDAAISAASIFVDVACKEIIAVDEAISVASEIKAVAFNSIFAVVSFYGQSPVAIL